ncbi:MAG: polysaccharide deacetylase family protein [Gammaproteobacteria bacterium]
MNRLTLWRATLHASIPIASATAGGILHAADSAVVFMYHHVDEDTPASTSVSPDRFVAHLNYLDENDFVVLPLMETLGRLRKGETIPDKAVVITFDDGYDSVLTRAAPELERRGWPFTVFVTTQYVDQEFGSYLSWDDLRTLARMGATIGNHTTTHAHLIRRRQGESHAQWRERVSADIDDAADRIGAELGNAVIPALAWPYGEYDVALKQIVADLGLIALGQHSGAIGPESDWLALPRFPVATGFDSLEDFALRSRTRPLGIALVEPEQHVSDGGSPPLEGRLTSTDIRREQLACFAGNQGRMELEWVDIDAGRFVARPVSPLRPGRTKYNCTAPSSTTPGVFHWYSYLWMTKRPDGEWYE